MNGTVIFSNDLQHPVGDPKLPRPRRQRRQISPHILNERFEDALIHIVNSKDHLDAIHIATAALAGE